MRNFGLFQKQGVDLKTAHENALNIARPWYKAFTIQDRVDAINSFLDRFPKKRIHEMPPLVQEMLLNIYQHAMRKEKYKPIVMLLQNRDMESFALLNQQFLKALQEGSEEKEILSYIQQGVTGNLHIRFEPVLRILIDKGYNLAAKELLMRGASPEPVPPAMLSILNKAIERENLQIVGLLLARGADPKYYAEAIAKLREKNWRLNLCQVLKKDLKVEGRKQIYSFNSQTRSQHCPKKKILPPDRIDQIPQKHR